MTDDSIMVLAIFKCLYFNLRLNYDTVTDFKFEGIRQWMWSYYLSLTDKMETCGSETNLLQNGVNVCNNISTSLFHIIIIIMPLTSMLHNKY
jgi:hypothetical protein